MDTTRQQIVKYLHNKQTATATEISNALGVTPANIRHHLSVLLNEGAIQITGNLPASGRGRPAQLFALTQQVQRHNLDQLVNALLATFIRILPQEEARHAWQAVAEKLYLEGKDEKSNLTARLYLAVNRLNEMNYQARWEAHSDAPHLILGHCPYAAIRNEYPEICQLDRHLIAGLLKNPVRHTETLAHDERGMRFCKFVLS